MPRLYTHLEHVYIADGFADDCDELIHRCSKVDFLTFATFCEIWKDMQLSCMYQDRTSGAEIAELSEEVLHVAKHYMVSNTENFEESIVGLFLVYALLNLQPYPGFASLRVVQDDLTAIERIETVARRERRFDVLYILGSVLTRWSEYHAAVRERGMEYPIRKYLEGHATVDRLGMRPKGVFYRQNEELDIIRELGSLEQRYNVAKTAITGTSEPDRNLNYTNTNLAKEMGDSLKNLITGIIEESDGDDDEDCKGTAQSIKQKAMKSKVKPMKHLVAVDTGNTTKPKSPRKKSDIKTSPGKVKTGSPTKPLTTNTPKKRKATPQRSKPSPKRKKPKPRITFESDDDEDFSLSSEDHSSDSDNAIISPHNDDSTQESIPQESVTEEQEIDIEIDMLPCFIRSEEGGKQYEIEIIDELKTNAAKTKHKKVSELPGADVTIQKISRVNNNSVDVNVVDPNGGMAEISKVSNETQINKKVTPKVEDTLPKRKGKRTVFKSKLHRLGVLAVADLEPRE